MSYTVPSTTNLLTEAAAMGPSMYRPWPVILPTRAIDELYCPFYNQPVDGGGRNGADKHVDARQYAPHQGDR
jgi:hypothetical protein